MQFQFNTPRGIVTSTNIPEEEVHKSGQAIHDVLRGKTSYITFEDEYGNIIVLSENIVKESIITVIED